MTVIPLFDYASLGNAAPEFQEAASAIRQIGAKHAIEIGQKLIGLKKKARHGTFLAWVSSELQMSPRTAQNMMAAARFVEGKSESISHLPPTILYKLASPKTDPSIVETVVEEVQSGKVVDAAKLGAKLVVAADAEREGRALFKRSEKTKPAKIKRHVDQRLDEQETFLAQEEKRRAELRPIISHIICALPLEMKNRLRAESAHFWRRDLIEMLLDEVSLSVGKETST